MNKPVCDPFSIEEQSIESLLARLILSDDVIWINSVIDKLRPQVLLELAIKHGVAAILYRAWLKVDGGASQIKGIDLFKVIDTRLKLMNGFLQPATNQVFSAFKEHEIPFVVLKGYALSHTIYQETYIRPRTDIDVLIDAKDSDKLQAILKKLQFANPRGWQPKIIIDQYSYTKYIANGVKLSLDIHLKISNDKALQEIITFDELITSGSEHKVNNISLISKPYALIHAVFHLLHHKKNGDFIKLVWYYDIHLLVDNMTYIESQKLTALIKDKKCSAVVNAVLETAFDLFKSNKVKLLIELLAGFESDPKFDYLLTPAPAFFVLWHNFTLVKGVRGKLNYILETVFPPKEEIYVKYGRDTKWPLALLYIKRMVNGINRLK